MRLVCCFAAAMVLAACSSSGGGTKPSAVRITAPDVAKSNAGTAFIVDLYSAGHSDFWRVQDQSRLVAIAANECITRSSATTDLASDFKGISPDAVGEFVALMDKDICPAMENNGGKLP